MPYEKVGNKEPVCIADEVPFEIPESWEWVRIRTILYKLSDGTHSRPQYVTSGIPFISVKDVSGGKLDFSACKYITIEEHKELYTRCNPEYGDILLTKVGTTGIPVIVDTNEEFSLFVSVALLKFNQDLLFNEFLVNLINSPLVQKQAAENTKGVGNKNWVMRDIANTLIVIPPLKEQHRIVSELGKYSLLLHNYNKKEIELSALNNGFPKLLKKSILQEAVQGKLVPQDENDEPASVLLERIRAEKQKLIKEGKIKKDKHESIIFRRDNSHYEKLDGIERCIDDEIPFDIPKSWCWTRLSSIASVLGGKRISAGRRLTTENTGHVYIRVSDMKDGWVSTDNLQYVPEDIFPGISKYIINKEDVFITVAGTIGRVGKIPSELDGANLTENADRLVFSILEQDWLILELQSSLIQTQIIEATTKVGQPKLAIARIENLLVALPPLSEQRRIVEKKRELFDKITLI